MATIGEITFRNFKSFRNTHISLGKGFNCVVGPNGAGKCVDGDTEIFLSDGSIVQIGDLVQAHLDMDEDVLKMEDGVCSLKNNGDLRVVSLNPETLKIEEKRIQAFIKRTSPAEMFEISTKTGKKVVTTGYHPVISIKNGEVTSLNAESLKVGSFIAIPRRLNIKEKQFSPILEFVKQDLPVYVNEGCDCLKERIKVKRKISKMTWDEISKESGIPHQALDSFMEGQAIRLKYAFKLAKFVEYTDPEIICLFEKVKGRSGNKYVRIPTQFNEDFAKFLGYIVSEGRIVQNEIFFFNDSLELRKDFADITKRLFDCKVTECRYKNKKFLILPSSVIVYLLESVFEQRRYGHSSQKMLPRILLKSDRKVISAFISSLYDGDGSIIEPSDRLCVEYNTASRDLAEKLSLLLLRLEIISHVSEGLKCATNTAKKIKRKYYRVTIYGVNNLKKIYENIKFVIPEKQQRLEASFETKKTAATAVDLIPEINPLIKSVLKMRGYTNKKLKQIKPSRIRAYYENRCLPSRDGLQAVVSLVMGSKQETICEIELTQLQKLAESEVFWDQIESITKIEGKEWVYDLTVERTHNFIANGIFVHNSNICDGIRFAFGEGSLRALRARRVQDLISSGSEKAVIRLKLENGDGAAAEIIRAIRKDGKTLYRLNGKRATRTLVTDFLKSEGLEIGPHNVIAQGEVEKIIRMTAKERREIIDDIAGVSEFESKKKEALSELGKVEQKLNDAGIVMKEREGILEELGAEKDAALKFLQLKDEQRRVKGTLVITTYKKSESQFTSLVNKCLEFAKDREELEKQLEKMRIETGEINKQIQEASSKISNKDTQRIYAEVEEMRGKISTDLGVKTEKDNAHSKAKDEFERLDDEEKDINGKLSSFSGAKRSAASRAAELKKRLEILEKEKDKVSVAWQEKRKKLKEFDDALDEKNVEMSKLQQELTKFSTQKEMKQPSGDKEKKKNLEKEKSMLEKNIEKFEAEVDALFNKEKDLNEEIKSVDSSILKSKEDIASMRGASRAPMATATTYVNRLKESGKVPGILGTIGDLFSSEKKYEIAAECAAGNRLNYVVVKDSETATEIVKLLKKDNAGRATFIPLDVIVLERSKEEKKGKGIVGKVVDLIQFDPRFESVFKYVFGDTLAVENVDVFRSISGTRMVTLDGDLAETSGIITGGTSIKRSVRSGVKVEQLERDVDGLKANRERILDDLRSISEIMSKHRRKIAEMEIKSKEIEIELGAYKELDVEDISKKMTNLQADIEDIERSVLDIRAEKERIRLAIENSEDEKEKATFEDEIISIKTEVSAIEEKLKSGEVIFFEERLSAINKQKADLDEEMKKVHAEIKEIDKRLKQNEKELGAKEEKIKDEGKILEKAYAKIKELQDKFDELNVERGKLERRIEKVKEDFIRNEANKDALATRLADLKAEADLYKDIEPISMKREDMESRVSEIETELQAIGFVNLKAPEMYEERLRDYNEIKDRVNVLSTEKEAVVKMIDEIDSRKKEVFMKTYDAVSEHFKKLATTISKYEATLKLENEADPFEGGLHIIVKTGKKDRNVELMSGGEKSLMTLVFVFALHMYRPSQFYILDETEAALDKENSKRFAELVKELSKETQFIVVSHNDAVIPFADVALGVTKTKQGSKIVGIKLMQTT